MHAAPSSEAEESSQSLPPCVLLTSPEGGRSRLLEPLRAQGLAVLVAPEGGVVGHGASGLADVVLLHSSARQAEHDLVQLREASTVPVVVLLREGRTRVARFFESGADDCVPAGAAASEVAARVRAVLRRRDRPSGAEVLRAGRFELDPGRHRFALDGAEVHLSPKEYGLLELLIRRDGRVVTRAEALDLVWGARRGEDPTTVDVHVKRLRAKVERRPAAPEHLVTVRGLGYRFQQ